MNSGYTYRETIKAQSAGVCLDAYLAERYRHSTLERWREHIEAGRVLLDGRRAPVDAPLFKGQRLIWHRPPWEEPEAPLGIEVLYEVGGVVVVHKPAGLPTLPGGGFLEHTLVHQLRLRDPHLSPVHRLGRWTSGAVVCSRSSSVGASLSAQLASRSMNKRYRALATGSPSTEVFAIDTPIGPVPYPPLGTLHAANPRGRPSVSRVRVVERREGAFLADVVIETGRPHQIRIQLASVGHPLVGDPLYAAGGLPFPEGTSVPGDPGYHLHAAEVGFDHPETHERVVVHAPSPEALQHGSSPE